jgi:hypothetical protein
MTTNLREAIITFPDARRDNMEDRAAYLRGVLLVAGDDTESALAALAAYDGRKPSPNPSAYPATNVPCPGVPVTSPSDFRIR